MCDRHVSVIVALARVYLDVSTTGIWDDHVRRQTRVNATSTQRLNAFDATCFSTTTISHSLTALVSSFTDQSRYSQHLSSLLINNFLNSTCQDVVKVARFVSSVS